jgi:hypothetical protein
MNMAYVSISTLRQHNKNIPIKLFFIQDRGHLVTTNNQLDYSKIQHRMDPKNVLLISQLFIEMMQNHLNVEVIVKPPHQANTEFVHANRMYISEVDEPNVLFIDSDTFIFGDVENIFKKYNENNFVALNAPWISKVKLYKNFSDRYFSSLPPFAGCILMFREGKSKIWANSIMPKIKELESDTYITEWMFSENLYAIREEIALLGIVSENKFRYNFFDQTDCTQINDPNFRSSTIVHTFSYLWLDAYKQIFNANELPIKINENRDIH